MDLRQLLELAGTAGQPWICKADLPKDLVKHDMAMPVPADRKLAWMDSEAMQTLDGLFDVIASELSFPDYFGGNWPAFDECLSDIYDFLKVRNVIIVFANAEFLLRRSRDDLPVLFSILGNVAAELAKEVAEGQPWDRPPVAFHAVFDLGIEVNEIGRTLPVFHQPR